MRVESNNQKQSSESTSNKGPAKSKKKQAAETEEAKKQAAPAPAKPEIKEATPGIVKAAETPDTKVELSAEAKAPSPGKKGEVTVKTPSTNADIKEAETLMEHVNSGHLSDAERSMALKRVGDVLKRYGNA